MPCFNPLRKNNTFYEGPLTLKDISLKDNDYQIIIHSSFLSVSYQIIQIIESLWISLLNCRPPYISSFYQ